MKNYSNAEENTRNSLVMDSKTEIELLLGQSMQIVLDQQLIFDVNVASKLFFAQTAK